MDADPQLTRDVGGAPPPSAPSPPAADAQPRASGPRRPSKLVTILLAGLGALGLALVYVGIAVVDPLDTLERPVETTIVALEGGLELLDASADEPWVQEFLELMGDDRDTLLDEAIETYEALGTSGSADPALESDARRAILLFERGDADEARELIASSSKDRERAPWVHAVGWAYGVVGLELDANTAREQLERLTPGWAKRAALREWAKRSGEDAVAAIDAAAERVHLTRLRRELLIGFTIWLVPIGAGLAIGCWWLLSRRRTLQLRGSASLPPSWNAIDGLGVATRGLWIHSLFAIAAFAVGSWFAPMSTTAALAMCVWLVWLYLERASVSRVLAALGLGRIHGSGLAWVGFVLVALALDQAGAFAWVGLLRPLDLGGHWTEGIFESLYYEPWPSALAFSADIGVVSPLLEEVLFRGLVYASLRSRMSPVAAAFTSSGAFSLLHGYSPVGFVVVAWSGLVWAFVYEKSRSLWPAVICHAFNNSMLAAFTLALNR